MDVPQKLARLEEWCKDVNAGQRRFKFDWLFIDEEGFDRYKANTFAELVGAIGGNKKLDEYDVRR